MKQYYSASAARVLFRYPTVSIALMLSACTIAHADKAFVIGVNEYPSLGAGANLEGCVNDAKNIGKSLQTLGFEVTILTNDQASKAAILNGLAELKQTCKPNERFVFYFAGHGTITTDGSSALLPSDASDKNETHDLGKDELYNAIVAIPARSRTSMLDSCFSGGLSRKGLGHKVKKSRYFKRNPEQPTRRDLAESNNQDNNNNVQGKGSTPIVYFTASLANQTSGEDDFEGVRGGVFTHFLTTRLNKAARDTHWSEVQKDVTGQVADYMDQTQTPKLSPTEVVDLPIFEDKVPSKPEPAPDPKPTPPPTPAPKRTLWDDFNEDRSDSQAIEITMSLNRATIKINEPFALQAKIGENGGWLVLLEKDTDGKVYLLWPQSHKLEDAKVSPKGLMRLPASTARTYKADTAGTERVKAILFTNEDNARALLVAFPADGAEPAKLRRITEIGVERKPFYTASLLFGVE